MKEKVIELLSCFGITEAASDPLHMVKLNLVEDKKQNQSGNNSRRAAHNRGISYCWTVSHAEKVIRAVRR